ncbi:MAG: MFS transporter, partial [Candidatus Methanofastidiosa archaeon]|nr:MFS transporter [Candidatus Methanofastidiosa archaeon]
MERERARYVDVLRNRNFGLLWAGQVVSNFGDRFTYMAVVATIVFNEGGSAMEAGGIFIAWSLPALIFGPIAGVFVDRYNKKRIMILCDILRAGIVFLLPFTYSIIQIYVLMFLVSSVSRFFYPARNAMIPQLVEKGQLLVANSLSQSTYEFSAIAGFAIGGMLVGIMGPNNVFYLDVATYFVSAITIYFIAFVPIGKKLEDAGNALSRIKMELLEGLVYSYREKRVFFILSIFSITMLFFG